MTPHFLGIDIGGTNTKLGLVTADAELVVRRSIPTEVALGPVCLVERIVELCGVMACDAGVSISDLTALGIGCPGPLSIASGKLISLANMRTFDGFALRSELSGRLSLPAVMDNDANVACWGEFWSGAGRGCSDMVIFTLGTGIGGGIVSDGRLVHGSSDNGAELGHMIIQPGGRRCGCGQVGCLEAHASAGHTAARAIEAAEASRSSSLSDLYRKCGSISCEDVFSHAAAGDQFANELVDSVSAALAGAAVNMLHILEPQIIVLAGGMAQAGEFLRSRVERFYEGFLWSLKAESMRICLGSLGDDAGAIGAAALAIWGADKGELFDAGT